jgi:transposase
VVRHHVEVDKHYYSAPHSPLREKVWVRFTARTVEIFHHGKRVAAHARTSSNRRHTTVADHMPASHRRYSEWSPERLTSWAAKIGPNTATLITVILRDRIPNGSAGSSNARSPAAIPAGSRLA